MLAINGKRADQAVAGKHRNGGERSRAAEVHCCAPQRVATAVDALDANIADIDNVPAGDETAKPGSWTDLEFALLQQPVLEGLGNALEIRGPGSCLFGIFKQDAEFRVAEFTSARAGSR